MCDRDIFEGDIEFLSPLKEISSDTVADGLTLSDELGGVELGYDGFENFIANGWEDTLIVILSKTLHREISYESVSTTARDHT